MPAQKYGYKALPSSEQRAYQVASKISFYQPYLQPIFLSLGALIICASCYIAGFLTAIYGKQGSHGASTTSETFLQLPGTQPQIWIYNRTFSEAPSDLSDSSWQSLFPRGVGFVQNPEIAPEISGISVFHQLHCLNSLRIAYYTALNKNVPVQHDDHNQHDDPHHVRHCIDYIRQSLICHADSTMEPVNLTLGGSTGWNVERQCRSYADLSQWAETWRKLPPS